MRKYKLIVIFLLKLFILWVLLQCFFLLLEIYIYVERTGNYSVLVNLNKYGEFNLEYFIFIFSSFIMVYFIFDYIYTNIVKILNSKKLINN